MTATSNLKPPSNNLQQPNSRTRGVLGGCWVGGAYSFQQRRNPLQLLSLALTHTFAHSLCSSLDQLLRLAVSRCWESSCVPLTGRPSQPLQWVETEPREVRVSCLAFSTAQQSTTALRDARVWTYDELGGFLAEVFVHKYAARTHVTATAIVCPRSAHSPVLLPSRSPARWQHFGCALVLSVLASLQFASPARTAGNPAFGLLVRVSKKTVPPLDDTTGSEASREPHAFTASPPPPRARRHSGCVPSRTRVYVCCAV